MPAPRQLPHELAGLRIAGKNDPRNFKAALNRLGSDNAFRDAVTKDPSKLTENFQLSVRELQALRTAAVLSGVDASVIDKQRARAITDFARVGQPAAWDVDVSCCCCCCCGESAVVHAA